MSEESKTQYGDGRGKKVKGYISEGDEDEGRRNRRDDEMKGRWRIREGDAYGSEC